MHEPHQCAHLQRQISRVKHEKDYHQEVSHGSNRYDNWHHS